MKQICITSTVMNSHLTVDENRFDRIKFFEFDKNDPFRSLDASQLTYLSKELESILAFLLRELDLKGPSNYLRSYIGHIVKLNTRNKDHMSFSGYLDLYDMVQTTINCSGFLFVFNKTLIKKNYSDEIIAYLRVHNYLTIEQIYNGVSMSMTQELPNLERMKMGLEQLIKCGLVYWDSVADEYSITAMGYMYW